MRDEGADDILSSAPKHPDFLVENFITRNSLNIIAGSPEAGKSVAVRTLAVAVAQGKEDWLGFPLKYKCPGLPGSVLCFFLEESVNEVKRHLVELGLKDMDELRLIGLDSGDEPMMCLDMACRTYRPDLVVIDTFAEFTGLTDVNSYSESVSRLQGLRQIANEQKTCIFLTHHVPKGASTAENAVLGSTAIRASVDSAILLRTLPRTRLRVMEPSKVRIGERFSPIAVGLGESRNSIYLGPAGYAEAEETISILAEILAMEGRALTKAELISATGLPPAAVWQALGKNPGNKIKKIVGPASVKYVLASFEEQDEAEGLVPF